MPHTKKALLCIDLINDTIHPDGKFANRGYVNFATEHDSLREIVRAQEQFRQQGYLIIHARSAFDENYSEPPQNSPWFNGMQKLGALQQNQWGTEFNAETAPQKGELVINKTRLNPFYRTNLETILREKGIEDLYICGVATEFGVSTAVFEARDRVFNTYVVSDACIAANNTAHEKALQELATKARVGSFTDFAVKLATA